MELKEEYDYLRKQIETNISLIHKTTNILYVGVTAILAWSIESNTHLICLLSFGIIIPTYCMVLDYQMGLLKIGAYLSVFYNDYHWEKRLHKMQIKNQIKRPQMSYVYPYIFTTIMSNVLFYILLLKNNNLNASGIIQYSMFSVISLSFIIWVSRSKKNDRIKSEYIEEWKKILLEEEKLKKHCKIKVVSKEKGCRCHVQIRK